MNTSPVSVYSEEAARRLGRLRFPRMLEPARNLQRRVCAGVALLALSLVAGCATPPVAYYYGNYSRTLYHSKKDGNPASIEKHRKSLEEIINTSEKKGLRVPPGIYCEYAYLLAKDGSPDADRYFSLEVTTYPESSRFVAFVRSQLNQ